MERFSPRYKEYVEPSYFNNDSDDDVFDVYICRDVYDPPDINWEIMKKAQQEREDRKPHGKGRVETVQFITTDPRRHKHKELSNIGAGASNGAKAPLSKMTIGARLKVKPQEEWRYGSHFPDPSIMDDEEEAIPRTKDRMQALEIYQKQELLHRVVVCHRLKEIEKKDDLLPLVTKLIDKVDTLQSDLRRCYSRITAMEDTNKKVRNAVFHAMAPQ